MDKFIGFDVDHKRIVACLTQVGRPERYAGLRTDVRELREWLQGEREPGNWLDRLNALLAKLPLAGSIMPMPSCRRRPLSISMAFRATCTPPTSTTWPPHFSGGVCSAARIDSLTSGCASAASRSRISGERSSA